MAKLPRAPDPDRLRQLEPHLIRIPAGTLAVRIYHRGGAHPSLWNAFRCFGPTGARFDHHELAEAGGPCEQSRGIVYLARDVPTALAEVFQRTRAVDRTHERPWLVALTFACELSLLDLTDTFCVRAGASMKLVSGPTVHARNWSRGFYDCYPGIHGLYYPSSLTNRPVIALYERAAELGPFPRAPRFHRALSDALLIEPLRNACREIGYDFV